MLVSWRKTGELDCAPSWEPVANLAKVKKAEEYLARHGIDPGGGAQAARAPGGRRKSTRAQFSDG